MTEEPDPSQQYADLYVPEDEDPRSQFDDTGDERTILTGYLRWQRETLVLKCEGLDAEQLARRAIPPSRMSLLGMIRHLSDVERYWWRQVMAGLDAPRRYRSPEEPDGEWTNAVADTAMVEEAWSLWREEVAWGDRFVADAADFDVLSVGDPDEPANLRSIVVHLIEEYARHIGHADILREQIDGRVGQ
jgi:uncharacterized damage-inducible protein DinB